MKWSEAVTLQFVKIYLRNECLWNPAHPSYKIKSHRDKSYWNIINEFSDATSKSLTIPEVKVKIKNLRTTYVQQVHKILQQSNPGSIYEPSLVWFNEMDKCLKHIPNRRHNTSNALCTSDPEVDSSSQVWSHQDILNETTEQNPDPLVPPVDEATDILKQEHTDKKTDFSANHKKNKKKKIIKIISIPDCSSDSVAANTQEDEFDIYGKYIASQLRQMDLHKALRLQLAIQNLVSEARISDVTEY